MPGFPFQASVLKNGLALAKIIKPETGDFCFQFGPSTLTILSMDKRRYVKSIVPTTDGVEVEDYISDEYHIGTDRAALFDTDLDSVTITVKEKSLSVNTTGNGQSRNASIKKKQTKFKAPVLPDIKNLQYFSINRKDFDVLLHQISCSAMIKESKTEEDMRIHQIHFYADKECSVSNARFYGTVAFLPGMKLDLSIISADIPIIRAFCSKCSGSEIRVMQDENHLYIFDPETDSLVSLSRIASKKPALELLDSDAFATVISIDQRQLIKNLAWAGLAIEGTQRLGVHAFKNGDSGTAQFFFGQDQISSFPITFLKGEEIRADFPVNVLSGIIGFLDGTVLLKYNHVQVPTILEITQQFDEKQSVKFMHYLQSMKSR